MSDYVHTDERCQLAINCSSDPKQEGRAWYHKRPRPIEVPRCNMEDNPGNLIVVVLTICIAVIVFVVQSVRYRRRMLAQTNVMPGIQMENNEGRQEPIDEVSESTSGTQEANGWLPENTQQQNNENGESTSGKWEANIIPAVFFLGANWKCMMVQFCFSLLKMNIL